MSFDDFGLSENILKAIRESGYETPTPIQEQAIPVALMGRDILGSAQTGTGKTAAFTLPMIEALATGRSRARMPRALILEPTRELAAQVADNFDKYGKYLKLTHALLIGGEFMSEQLKTLERGVDVLIATPGRLIDMFERGKIMMSDVKIFVIDEADRMLDMGFIPDVEKIASLLPPLRQTMLFSATMPPEIKRLAEQFLMNPKLISVSPPASPAETVEQRKLLCQPRDKRKALLQIMRGQDITNAIVFCNRKRDVDLLLKALIGHGVNAAALHGDMVQFKRMETLDRFKKGEVQILVASDVAARGLDIPTVGHVFNFDVPYHPDDYIHRIGRTGRAGRSGKSYTLVTDDDAKSIAAIERLIKRDIPTMTLEGVKESVPNAAVDAAAAANDDEQPARRRRESRRPARAEGEEKAPPRVRTRRAKTTTVADDVVPAEDVAAEAVVQEAVVPEIVIAEDVAVRIVETIEAREDAAPVAAAPRQPDSRSAERRPSSRPTSGRSGSRPEQRSDTRAEPRRGRRDPRSEEAADIPGPQSFGVDNTPAFLLRPSRKVAAG